MSIIHPELEYVDRSMRSIRYLQHGWPSDLCRWHAHEEYELHLIVDTRGKAFIGDYIGDFGPGSLFMTGPNLPHNWVTDDTSAGPIDLRDMLVQFSHDSVEKLADGFPEFRQVLTMLHMAKSGIQFDGFNPTFARGHMETIRDNTGSERILAFVRFLVRLHEHVEKRELSASKLVQAEGGSRQARIGRVVDHIIANFMDPVTVAEAADMAGMTQATFSRNFLSITGHGLVDFVNRVRVSQACGMLYASDEPVAEICQNAGFKNLANFHRQFARIKGMTPSTYREMARQELITKLEDVV